MRRGIPSLITFSYLFSKHLAHMKEHLLSTKKLDIILTFST